MQRFLGIDYGAKRIGLAISDEKGEFAFPLRVLSNTPRAIEEICAICKEEEVGGVILGESFAGEAPNAIMEEITPFKEKLRKECGVGVEFQREYNTSVEAQRFQGMNDMEDASAAAIILQRFLDKQP